MQSHGGTLLTKWVGCKRAVWSDVGINVVDFFSRCPKSSHSSFHLKVIFLKQVEKLPNTWKKICHPDSPSRSHCIFFVELCYRVSYPSLGGKIENTSQCDQMVWWFVQFWPFTTFKIAQNYNKFAQKYINFAQKQNEFAILGSKFCPTLNTRP